MDSRLNVGPRSFRFRMDREPDEPGTSQARWKARYSYGSGWAPFEMAIDYDHRTCSFHRAPGIPYGGLLCDLVEKMTGVETASAPLVRQRVNAIVFSFDTIGRKMSRHADPVAQPGLGNGPAGQFRESPPGPWLVIRATVAGGGESFLLAINERQGVGEIVPGEPGDGLAIVEAFTDLFGDSLGSSSMGRN